MGKAETALGPAVERICSASSQEIIRFSFIISATTPSLRLPLDVGDEGRPTKFAGNFLPAVAEDTVHFGSR